MIMTSEATTTTYVAYQHPGTFFWEESKESVDMRNPQQQANNAPDSAFAFYYFDIVTMIVDVEGERIETSSDRRNISKTYYVDAELLDYDAVSALPGDNSILLSNMRCNEWDTIVRCRTGNFQTFVPARHELLIKS
jgi:hypothetical protein